MLRAGGSRGGRPSWLATTDVLPGLGRTLRAACRLLPAAQGVRPHARQIRDIDGFEMSISFAIDRVDQCVAFFGVDSSVRVTTAATCSSVTVLGPPGRGCPRAAA